METVTTQGTSVSYPVYDGHGNMVATLAKQGSGYQIGNRRSFGAWGDVRQGNSTGDPKGKYCANLGHLDDDESGLTYMRARYYEASSGRLLSEDPAFAKGNWYVYSKNDPVNFVDSSGKDATALFGAFLSGLVAALVRMGAKSQSGFTPADILNAFLGGIAGYVAAKVGGRVTEALEVGASATIGAWVTGMSVGGFVNAAATLLINLITGDDTDLGDLVLAFLTGAVGAGASYGLGETASDSARDNALGLFCGAMSEFFGGLH